MRLRHQSGAAVLQTSPRKMRGTRNTMKIVIAIDSLKGSLTSLEAGNAAAEGILAQCPDASVIVRPLADGGEGTVDALTADAASEGLGTFESVTVTGPLGESVCAGYGILRRQAPVAVIESSAACGLPLVPDAFRNPMNTTTHGLGEMILDAVAKGCRHFVIGIGGSSTNDGGAGMLQALGYRLIDASGNDIGRGAQGLRTLVAIEPPAVSPLYADSTIRVACDVTNPLCGSLGCSAVFGPQKGAKEADIPVMDEALRRYAELLGSHFPNADPDAPGSGAAGGLGFAFRTVLGADLVPGSQLILEETNLASYLTDADLVITGEGRLDSQTAMGKAPAAVAALARAHGIPVIALAGSIAATEPDLRQMGFTAWYGINDHTACDLATAMRPEVARRNMSETAGRAVRELNR